MNKSSEDHYLLLMHPLAISEDFVQGFSDKVTVLDQDASDSAVRKSVQKSFITILKVFSSERLTNYLNVRHNLLVVPARSVIDGDRVSIDQVQDLLKTDTKKYVATDEGFNIGTFELIKDFILEE